jgi:superfamily II DNA or RNA helicase
MIDIKSWRKEYFFEAATDMVSGPGIEALQHAILDMGSRGAPFELNNWGFNQGDYASYGNYDLRGYLTAKEVPAGVATDMLRVLSHYKNRQVLHYPQIAELVQKDLMNASQKKNPLQPVQNDSTKVVVFDRQPEQYGKVKVYIPNGVDRSLTLAINKIIDANFVEEGQQKQVDDYGNLVFPRYKKYSPEKGEVHVYRFYRGILNSIVELLKSKGYEVEFESGKKDLSVSDAIDQKSSDIEIIGVEKTDWGQKLGIRFNIPYEKSKAIFDHLKQIGYSPKFISYASNPSRFLIDLNKNNFEKVVQELNQKGLNTSELENFAKTNISDAEEKSPEKQEDQFDKQNMIQFRDERDNRIRIKMAYFALSDQDKAFLKECVQYSFPDYDYNRQEYSYYVSGNFKQYISFGKILKKFGYNVDELRKIVKDKLRDDRLEETRWEGMHDSDEGFIDQIDKNLPDSNFDLYRAQKEGIAFLYGRDHAILGDETGLGKTAQLISAAALRMQKDSKPTLIITLKATQEQWVNEIVNVMGEDQRSDISKDPQNPKKWTVVYYENFSSGKQIENNMEKLKSAGFGIVIFDELHKIKHSSSKRSQNISKVVENIPTKWGASATISSNKPMDVRNQLVMTGHHLGKINEKKFKRDFAGQNYENDSEENKIKSAENLNKWLNLSGLYVRRSKQDIREMPNLSIQNKVVSIDQSKFGDEFNSKISAYKDPQLPISQLIAARETIAKLKTDQTSNKVLDIVKKNINGPAAASKIVVFTNFKESADQLVKKINSGLKSIDPNFNVMTYLASTKKQDRLTTKKRFTDDSNAKVLVMSMRMGGTGIDFPNAAQNMVINDFDWTPESAEQSEGRIYRINTNHPVNIDYVVADGIDKTIYDKVQKKRELAEIIQKYRKEYHEKDDSEALKIIVKAQKDMADIDKDMVKAINSELPGAGKALEESFKSYVDRYEQFKDLLLYGISLDS